MQQLPQENYYVQVTSDSIVGSLPYFGQIYSANQAPTSLQFISTKFDYDAVPKKGKWEITIKPKDNRGVTQLFLTVFSDGATILLVNSAGRETVSFNGFITIKEGTPIKLPVKAVPTTIGAR